MQSSNTHNGFCVLSQKFCEWCKIFDRDQAPAFWMYALNNDNFKVLMLMMEISWWPKLHSDICKSGLNSDSDLCWVTTRTRTRAHEWTRLNVGIAQKCAVGFDRALDNQIIQCTSGKGINVKVWYGRILCTVTQTKPTISYQRTTDRGAPRHNQGMEDFLHCARNECSWLNQENTKTDLNTGFPSLGFTSEQISKGSRV